MQLSSRLCVRRDFDEPWFRPWQVELRNGWHEHRKLWEYVLIARALEERGLLVGGKSGLGFGVGAEPLVAAFAARGARITATDQWPSEQARTQWGAQFCEEMAVLNGRSICPPREFEDRVRFRRVDMNELPAELGQHDFLWSSCALEHLGTLEHGFRFIKRSLDFLKPGGWAIHTTEFNLSSGTRTVEAGKDVFYRLKDIRRLERDLRGDGHELTPLKVELGDRPQDAFVDMPPFGGSIHLKLCTGELIATSLLLVVQKR